MKQFPRITLDPAMMGGRACIRGMRMTASMVVGLLAAGRSREEILDAYPELEPEDIDQALGSAAEAKTPVARQAVFRRNFVCRFCGAMRRAYTDPTPDAPPPPGCCGHPMRLLAYEQVVASARMAPAARAAWLAAGGKIARRGGKRQWRPV